MSVVTITGDNDWARRQALRKLVDEFVAEHTALALERLDAEEVEFARIQEALTSLPFLASKKMVVLSRPSASAEFAEAAEKLLAELPDTTDLVLYEPKFDKRGNLYKFIKRSTELREFNPLDGNSLAAWLVDEAAARGASLSFGDARYLVERVGTSQQQLDGELDKLRLYDAKITRANIDRLTEPTPQSKIFHLIDAAFAGNSKRALQLYDEQRLLKVEPQQILAMFARQLYLLALVKAAGDRPASGIAAEAKQSPYAIESSQKIARQLTIKRLLRIINDLLSLDIKSKSSSLDLDDALRTYILELKA